MNKNKLLENLKIAFTELYKSDLLLIKNETSERAILWCLKWYLKELSEFKKFDIDIEYNREWTWNNSKRNEINKSTTADLLIHTRENTKIWNLLYLEAKTFYNINDRDKKEDINTIKYFISKFNYSYGMFICFFLDKVEYTLFYDQESEEWFLNI